MRTPVIGAQMYMVCVQVNTYTHTRARALSLTLSLCCTRQVASDVTHIQVAHMMTHLLEVGRRNIFERVYIHCAPFTLPFLSNS